MHRLKDVHLFSKLSPENIENIRSRTLLKPYPKGGIVFYEEDTGEHIYVLLEGTVKLYKTSPKGTQIQINRFVAPALIGEYVCFEKAPFPATCEFVTDGAIGLLHFDKLYEYLKEPAFSLELIKSLTGKVLLLSSLVHKETILSSEAKVADLIIKKRSIFNRLKNNEIASMLNLTPETFSRILTKFKKEQIISIKHHQLEILNEDALYAIVETNTIKECTNCIAHFKKEIGYEE